MESQLKYEKRWKLCVTAEKFKSVAGETSSLGRGLLQCRPLVLRRLLLGRNLTRAVEA